MKTNEKRKMFLGYANEIKNLGYKVFVSKPTKISLDKNYGWIVNEKDEIGYFQYEPYCGVRFSTIHKPMNEYGSGFSCENDRWNYHTTFSKEIVDRCFARVPGWMFSRPSWEKKHLDKIRKWTATEYFEKYWDKANLIEL